MMHKIVVKAVKRSVCKWDLFAQGIGEFSNSCPLCPIFFASEGKEEDEFIHVNCFNGFFGRCPIYANTGKEYCENTNFYEIREYFQTFGLSHVNQCMSAIDPDSDGDLFDMVEGMIELLIGLLPEEEIIEYNKGVQQGSIAMADFTLEIAANVNGDKLAYLSKENADYGYHIAGPKAWGGGKTFVKLKVLEKDLIEFINIYAPDIIPKLKEPDHGK